MKNNKLCTCSALFFKNLNEPDVKFPFATLFGGRRHKNQFNFFSESELGCGPQVSVGELTYICYFKTVGINAKKFFFFFLRKGGKKKRKKSIHLDS